MATLPSGVYLSGGVKALHPRNLHKQGYDFAVLVEVEPSLKAYVVASKAGNDSINYSDPAAVKALNTALLAYHYDIEQWDIPEGFLCPPVPGRVDYLHYMADVLGVDGNSREPLKMLDIGTGANGIYSLLAAKVYGWQCVASDIDPASITNLNQILEYNPNLHSQIETRLQPERSKMFANIVADDEQFDLSMCNPPFHASLEEALKGSEKKRKNLLNNQVKRSSSQRVAVKDDALNFGGQKAELWCKGGEAKFLRMMIKESLQFAEQFRWFSSLVSKSENLKAAQKLLRKQGALDVQEIDMHQGNKITRILVWRY